MSSPDGVPPKLSAHPGRAGIYGLLLVALAAVVASVLFVFDPSRYPFYPQCLFHSLTGLDCPGCGSLRALHQLLHGNLRAAFAFNPLLLGLLPVFGWLAAALLLAALTGRQFRHPFNRPVWVWLLAVTVVLFGIFRNLPLTAVIWPAP